MLRVLNKAFITFIGISFTLMLCVYYFGMLNLCPGFTVSHVFISQQWHYCCLYLVF